MRDAHLSMRNLSFGFFDDSGLPRDTRILIFYSFETDERLARSGILHYHLGEGRFVGPRHARQEGSRRRAPDRKARRPLRRFVVASAFRVGAVALP